MRFALPLQQKKKLQGIMYKKLLLILATALLLGAAYVLTENIAMPLWAQLLVYLVPYLLVGHETLHEAWEGICEGEIFDEDFLMSIATLGALLIGFLPGAEAQFPEAVFVMLFFQVGEMFEHYAEERSHQSIADLMNLRPDVVHVERNGQLVDTHPEEVLVGETVVVKPGEKVPLDGEIIQGQTTIDTRALTGESLPQRAGEGSALLSGSINLSAVITLRVTKVYSESTAARITDLVEHSMANKSKSETFIHRFARVYTPIVVCTAMVLAFLPPFFSESYVHALPTWLYRALTFLVVSCPCALVVSIPLTFFAGIGGAGSKGILVKGGNFMEALAQARTVVFDKTGTLTHGVFQVTTVHANRLSSETLVSLVASVEHLSTHPIALAIVREASTSEQVPVPPTATDIQEVAGKGIVGYVAGQRIAIGNEKMMQSEGVQMQLSKECEAHVGTIVHVAIDNTYEGHLVISDQIKEDAAKAIAHLKSEGITKTVMLTGDNEVVADAVAKELQLDAYHAALMPADKVDWVEHLLEERSTEGTLLFVGDGINDAPVLARADVGIAMGALGSDAAIEAADVVLMDDKPSKIALAIRHARCTISIARQNAWCAIGIKVAILIGVALGLFGAYAMPLAVFGDVGVMVLCVLNAMRAMRA